MLHESVTCPTPRTDPSGQDFRGPLRTSMTDTIRFRPTRDRLTNPFPSSSMLYGDDDLFHRTESHRRRYLFADPIVGVHLQCSPYGTIIPETFTRRKDDHSHPVRNRNHLRREVVPPCQTPSTRRRFPSPQLRLPSS